MVHQVHVEFRSAHPELYPETAFEGPLHVIRDPSKWVNRGYGIGVQAEDRDFRYRREPTEFPNGFVANYKCLDQKEKQYSVLPKAQDGDFYVELVPTISGQFHIRVLRQTEEPRGKRLGELNLETGFFANSRELYQVSADNLPPLSKEAAGYLKASPQTLKNLMRKETAKIGIGREVYTVCRDANLFLALMQGVFESDSQEKNLEFRPRERAVLESSSSDLGELPEKAEALFALLDQYPTLFPRLEHQEHGCTIVRTPGEVALADPDGKCGIVHKDERMVWLRLPLRFADGSYGLRNEFIQPPFLKSLGAAGSAILGRDKEGRYLMLIDMRIPTARLEVELSKGLKDPKDKDLAACAEREVREEMQRKVEKTQLLGYSHTGLDVNTHESYPVYLVDVGDITDVSDDSQEDIREVLALTLDQIKQAYSQGYLEREGVQYSFKDPNLAFALGKLLLQES